MKFTKITLSVALLGAFTLGMADDTAINSNGVNADISAKIEKMKKASPEQRVQLMNEFKQELDNISKEDRMQAMSQMREKMQGKESALQRRDQAQNEREHSQEMGQNRRQRTQDMVQTNQAKAMEHMHQMQNMNQMQAGDQMHTMEQMQGAKSENYSGGMSGGKNH